MIVRDIAERIETRLLGENGFLPAHWDYSSAAEVMAEIATLVPAYAEVLSAGEGVLRRFEPDGRGDTAWSPPALDEIPRFASDEFPITLIAERNLFYYHGACLTEQVKGMNLVKQEEILHLSLADATRLGITHEDLVEVVSAYGSAECMAQVDQGMPEGTAFISINPVNGSSLFPALTPGAKVCAIRVEGVKRQT